MNLKRFNVRVYGLLINEHRQILVSDEQFKNGTLATKFPGGGLELGEGTKDCLIREFREETGVAVHIKSHFYTTDYFQPSFLDNDSQIISIYYLVSCSKWQKIRVSAQRFDFHIPPGNECESFRWVPINELSGETSITLPIDKIVVKMLAAL